ncbi:DNA polymerase III subunit delta' [Acetomicrobium hydrogeniformans]|uniref:DNA polymerase III subunit delta n=1 Tax=Acetomicrobium hydrogeniformans TaxID=649746 RepID=A0A7V6ZFP9_9BACT|nr:DNA polymerase III subunit delta' [Acetomicrobium hydrogeniformans]HHZ05138.1 DNA polymerase III subunit delta' [Acetomicrobium hydrogeniformans]
MSDIALAIRKSEAYKMIATANISSRAPHALFIEAPDLFHEKIAVELARLYLCESGSGDDECPSCRSWNEGDHPDFIRPVAWGKSPGIDDCRKMAAELYLAPVVAPRRFLAIPRGSGLSLPAANSLLKILEEPPTWGALLILSDGGGLPETIKSRTWQLTIDLKEEVSLLALPEGKDGWLSLIASASEMTQQEALVMMNRWTNWCLGKGEIERAAMIDKIRLIAEKGHIPNYMAFDLLYGFLEEELSDELFDNLW